MKFRHILYQISNDMNILMFMFPVFTEGCFTFLCWGGGEVGRAGVINYLLITY